LLPEPNLEEVDDDGSIDEPPPSKKVCIESPVAAITTPDWQSFSMMSLLATYKAGLGNKD